MDNLSENIPIDEDNKQEKDSKISQKAEEITPKHEKLPNSDFQNFPVNKHNESYKSPDGSKSSVEKQRLRQYVQSRTDIQPLDSKILSLKKSHDLKYIDRINISRVPFLPLLSIRTNAIEEMYKEIKELKGNITELEERNKVNSQCIQIGKVKIQDLEDRHSNLRKKAGIGCTYEERKEEYNTRLKNIQNS